MYIDLSIINFTGTQATSYNIIYARIDNVTSPVYSPFGNFTAAQFPVNIPDIPNGQYSIGITPVYADGRSCSTTYQTTPACSGIIALNATQDNSGNLKITYTAPGSVPQVLLKVTYPNGGSYQQAYTNGANSSTILIPLPTGVTGNYLVYMQSICDPDTQFYSPQTPPVTVTVGGNTVNITNNAGGTTITAVNGITGYSLSAPLPIGSSDSGNHSTFTGSISATFTGTPATNCSAQLYVNGTLVQCQNLPNTAGGSVLFTSGTYYSTDILILAFAIGNC